MAGLLNYKIFMPPLCGIFFFVRGVMALAATRLIALHKNKGKSVAACLKSRTDYAQNPDKTNKGELVSSYECSPLTADEEFMLSKRQYDLATGRRQKSDVIAYQIRQSFRPGEITAEEANKVGYELAMRFTKGKHAFGLVTVGDKGQIVIPAKARKIFNIQPGDRLIVLGDEAQGLALLSEKDFLAMVRSFRTQGE